MDRRALAVDDAARNGSRRARRCGLIEAMLFRAGAMLLIALVVAARAASAQSAENVALVINELSPDSQRIAERYVRARNIPASNIFRVRAPLEEVIERSAF